MQDVKFNCPNCNAEIAADPSMAGTTASCPGCNTEIQIPIPGISSGMNLAGFKLERCLGSGAMGEVWLAHQTAMERMVAIKILSPALTDDKEFVARFLQEIKVGGKLEHPNIVTAFDAGKDKGLYYMATSYVEGVELGNLIKAEKIIPEDKALEITYGIANALKYAWDDFKILHRDIKPSNIMLDKKGVPKLMDLGISKSLTEDSSLTMTGMIVGTPYYMSPEQALAKPDQDFRVDLYSLGATLYHMTTGKVPYDGETAVSILTKHITESLPDPRETNPEISEPCAVLIEIMMAKNKKDRQPSWTECINDIENVIEGKMPLTKPVDMEKTFTETRTFINPAKSYETRLQRFKSFKPSIVHEKPVKPKKKIPDTSRLDSTPDTTKIMKKFEPPPNAEKKKQEKTPRPCPPVKKHIPAKYLWPLLGAGVLILLLAAIFLANAFIKKVEELKGQLDKTINTRKVITTLHQQAKPLLEDKKYKKAAAVYINYTGPAEKETRSERESLAKECLKMAQKSQKRRKHKE